MMRGSMELCEEEIAFAVVNISITEMEKAREVSFTSVITSFVIDGRIFFQTCGKMMRRKDCLLLYPSL